MASGFLKSIILLRFVLRVCLLVPIAFVHPIAEAQIGTQNMMQPPTDIDLKAAYCLGVTRAQSAAVSSVDLRGFQQDTRALIDKHAQELKIQDQRLLSYLVPRSIYLDVTGLLTANNRGKADVKASFDLPGECERACKDRECWATCWKEAPVSLRTKSCKGATFLPF